MECIGHNVQKKPMPDLTFRHICKVLHSLHLVLQIHTQAQKQMYRLSVTLARAHTDTHAHRYTHTRTRARMSTRKGEFPQTTVSVLDCHSMVHESPPPSSRNPPPPHTNLPCDNTEVQFPNR